MLKPDYHIIWRFPDGTQRRTEGYEVLNLLAHAEMYDLILPQACGGQAECGTCRLRVVEGHVTTAMGDEEELQSRHRLSFGEDERLACRVRPLSDLIVELRATHAPDLRREE